MSSIILLANGNYDIVLKLIILFFFIYIYIYVRIRVALGYRASHVCSQRENPSWNEQANDAMTRWQSSTFNLSPSFSISLWLLFIHLSDLKHYPLLYLPHLANSQSLSCYTELCIYIYIYMTVSWSHSTQCNVHTKINPHKESSPDSCLGPGINAKHPYE